MSERRFTVLRGQSRLPHDERMRWPESLPWSMVEPWRQQAESNHGQTLERLNMRGGLSPQELWLAAHGHKLFGPTKIEERAAAAWLTSIAVTS